MNDELYMIESARTDNGDDHYAKVLERVGDVRKARLIHAAMGLSTEPAEIMDQLKRHFFYGTPLDEANLIEEIGDMLWYAALMLRVLDSSLGDAMQRNIAKLLVRYPQKFEERLAIERDLIAERTALEAK